MITGKLKNDIDKLWEEFWTGAEASPHMTPKISPKNACSRTMRS
jgi:hypothetical protein